MNDSLHYTPACSDQLAPAQELSPGYFIVFEGGDGAGKSTQIRLLNQALQAAGWQVTLSREPGGTAMGEKLRQLVLDGTKTGLDGRAEALIFAASRAAHAQEVIRPALAAGHIVLCDRYIDSSLAYQGAGRGLGVDNVRQLNLWATQNLLPDLTILLDLPFELGRARAGSRGQADRMEAESDQFHRVLGQTYRDLATQNPERYALIDASATIKQIHRQVKQAVSKLIKEEQ